MQVGIVGACDSKSRRQFSRFHEVGERLRLNAPTLKCDVLCDVPVGAPWVPVFSVFQMRCFAASLRSSRLGGSIVRSGSVCAYHFRLLPSHAWKVPVSSAVSPAITFRIPVMDSSGLRFASGPPMSVRTHPGLTTTQVKPSSL